MLRSFFQSIRHNPAVYVANTLEKRARRALAENATLAVLFESYQRASVSTGVSYSDYVVLYNWVREHKPREILECGTGISTVVMAQALRENEEQFGIKGRITSMEEYEEYFTRARAIFPAELGAYVDLRLSPAVEDRYHFFRGVRYADLPDRAFDFVFVDGPSLHSSPSDDAIAINMDLITLLQRTNNPIAAIIDTRTTTCFAYSLLLPKTFRYDYLRRIGVVLPSSKKDLLHPKQIVGQAMVRHAFRRPTFISSWRGSY